jgi:hypothetical protein
MGSTRMAYQAGTHLGQADEQIAGRSSNPCWCLLFTSSNGTITDGVDQGATLPVVHVGMRVSSSAVHQHRSTGVHADCISQSAWRWQAGPGDWRHGEQE